jgi:hypothetical protein
VSEYTDRGLKAARRLAEWGVPIFLAQPALDANGGWDFAGGHNGTGYLLPRNWQHTKADPNVLDRWVEGMAVCLVTGVVVDGLDLDAYKNGSVVFHSALRHLPTRYGLAVTPSGGRHHLIAPLGVASRDGVLPGVDVKAGTAAGGRGFLFIAPTRKVSKTSGEVGEYRWTVEPDLEDLLLLGTDDSGAALRDLIEQARAPRWTAAGYAGPSFDMLGPRHQERAQRYLDEELERWRLRLEEAADWPEGHQDAQGRGWEALSRDLAWTMARLAVAPWAPEFDPEQAYLDLLPDVMAANPKCQGKWRDGLVEKAAAEPADEPPWVRRPEPADDFEPAAGDEVAPDLFSATPVLAHIRQAARARRVPPYALLGQVLARVAVELPPTVQLPPLVGGAGTLNVAFGLVGGSGAGKSVSEAACRDLFATELPPEWRIGPGSGEGLVESFIEVHMVPNPQTGKLTKVRRLSPDPQRLLVVDEILHLDAIQARSGSSMAPLLRTALTGGQLTTTTANADTRRNVPAQAYRLAVVAGIQPENAGVLLADAGSGTPQRWVWLPTDDPAAPDVAPEWPGCLDWSVSDLGFEPEVTLPQVVKDEVDVNRLARLRTKVEKLDGQWMVTKEKVAVLLAALHGSLEVTEQLWDLAGALMAVSDRERDACVRLFQSKSEREQVARKRAESNATARVVGDQVERAVKLAVTKLRKSPGEWVAWRDFKPTGRAMFGLDRDQVIEELEDQAGVEIEQSEERGKTVVRARFVG